MRHLLEDRGPVRRGLTVAAAAAVIILVGAGLRPAAAETITIDPTSMTGVYVTSTNGTGPNITDAGGTTPAGTKAIGWFNANVAVEFPVTVTTAGTYTASAMYGTPNVQPPDNGLPVAITLDIRPAGSEQHYGTPDIVLPKTGDDDSAYGLNGATFSAEGIVLQPGNYVLRVRNVSLLHTTTSTRSAGFQYRPELNYALCNRSVNFGAITLTSTGPAPAMGTISGKVSASDLGYGVGGAYVMAVPPGSEIAEPGPFWHSGYWTITDASGNFTLPVPAGSYTVQAGRPDMYDFAGGRTTGVAVTSGATATANVSMKSRWDKTDGTGRIQVEEEYFHAKPDDAMPDITAGAGLFYTSAVDIQGAGEGQNGFKVSYVDASDFLDVYVDIPKGQGGAYDLFKTYTSGMAGGGTTRFIANPGDPDESSTETLLPNSGGNPDDPARGYYTPTTVLYPDTINLHEGRNLIRELSVTGGVDYDCFALAKHADIPSGPGVANPKDANFTMALGEQGPGVTTTPQIMGNTIMNFYRGSYVEIPMTFNDPGIYRANVSSATNVDGASLQLDLRPENTENHYATADTPVPNSGSYSAYVGTTIDNIPVLGSGNYILRVRNTTKVHTTAADRTPIDSYVGGAFVYNGVNLGQIVFTKTANLPATGTVSGSVKASNIGGFGVANAFVMANAPGGEIAEPSPFWQKGFWTTSDATGSFTLPLLAGSYTVQAGRPDMYAFIGASTSATVASGGTATATINLPSRYTQDATGHWTVMVESEYFTGKQPDAFGTGAYQPSVIVLQGQDNASNGIRAGYTDPGDYIDINVDVPAGAAGEYTLEDHYFNGYWDGVSRPEGDVSFTANVGEPDESVTQAMEPNTAPDGAGPDAGYSTPGTKVFPTPIKLREGHNVIRQQLNAGSSTFDAFKLTSVATFAQQPTAHRALRILAGLDPAPTKPGADFSGLDAVADGVINAADAVKLAQQGKP